MFNNKKYIIAAVIIAWISVGAILGNRHYNNADVTQVRSGKDLDKLGKQIEQNNKDYDKNIKELKNN